MKSFDVSKASKQDLVRHAKDYSPCDYADALPRGQFIDYTVKPLHSNIERISGTAFTVKCAPGDHLGLHAAIYQAQAGDIIVVEADDQYALAGGNVCAIAQKRGIKGFVIDGVIRDLAEVRDIGFAVFAKGVMPKPGKKESIQSMNQTICCAGVKVHPGDIIIADEEGIAVVPQNNLREVFESAKARAETDAALSVDEWQEKHYALIQKKLAAL